MVLNTIVWKIMTYYVKGPTKMATKAIFFSYFFGDSPEGFVLVSKCIA
jgi:hypothetical protein